MDYKEKIDRLFAAAERVSGYTREEIQGKSRVAPLCEIRIMVADLMVEVYGMSLAAAAEQVGRTHSAVLTLRGRLHQEMSYDRKKRLRYNQLKNEIMKKPTLRYVCELADRAKWDNTFATMPSTTFEELELDELETFDFLCSLETAFNIGIFNPEIFKGMTMEEIYNLLEKMKTEAKN